MGQGTLRIMALTLLPYLTDIPSVVVVEEPDNGIHYLAVDSVLESLTSITDKQIWISTHSPVVLAQVELDNVICAVKGENNAMDMIPGPEHPGLKSWIGALGLFSSSTFFSTRKKGGSERSSEV